MTFEEARKRLSQCLRGELRDHAFGDCEITWFVLNSDGMVVAEAADGYFGGRPSDGISVYQKPKPFNRPWNPNGSGSEDDEGAYLVDDDPDQSATEFSGAEASELRKCGRLSTSRNDSTGPDRYAEGSCMPGLTLEGVRRELTGE